MVSETAELSERARSLRARRLDIDGLIPVGRLGWVAKGVVYGLVGVLTVPIAFSGGGGGEEASRSGAVAEIAEESYGTILLWILAVGLVLYALWRLVTAFLPGENDAETLAHRVAYLFSAVVYSFLAWTAVDYATGGGSSSGGSGGGGSGGMLEDISRTLMESTIGRWALGLGALVGLGVAGYFAYKAIDKRFMDQFDFSDASSEERELIEKTGMAGWIGRAITTGLLAGFVLLAAITANPDEAKGLDGALRDVADNWWGSVLVLVAGVGLVCYGMFAAISARRRLLVGP